MEKKEGKKLSSYLLDRPRSSMVANEEGNFPDDVGKVHGQSTILMRRQARTYDNSLRERR